MQRVSVSRERPQPWHVFQERSLHPWLTPLILLEWWLSWVAYLLSNWAFLEVLDYAGTFSILVVVILYFTEKPDRVKQKHYQAWQVINTAQGKGGSGGRIDALEELNNDRVPLVGVDAQGAFLMGLRLDGAPLARANFSRADLRNCSLRGADLQFASLGGANLRNCDLAQVRLEGSGLSDADFTGANLTGANLAGTDLANADLRESNLQDIRWKDVAGIRAANVFHAKNAPQGFLEWAVAHGAVAIESDSDWQRIEASPDEGDSRLRQKH